MCGRYSSSREPGDLARDFEAVDATGRALPPDYNVAPTEDVYVVRRAKPARDPDSAGGAAGRELRIARWGLVPSWAADEKIGARMLNARAETLTSANAFRKAAASRRCLVPADGWYEWSRYADRPGKQAFYITPRDGSVVALAGLYEFWRQRPRTAKAHDGDTAPGASDPSRLAGDSADDWLVTCTIVTTSSIDALAEIHERMPLALDPSRWSGWLDPQRSDPSDLLTPDPEFLAGLEIRPVGGAVGNVENNYPSLQDEEPGARPAADLAAHRADERDSEPATQALF